MSRYCVALVRFTANGRTYPVNCCRSHIKPGDRVVVRLEKQERRLQAAEVVELSSRKRACANSIVCMEAEKEDYNNGPAGVETLESLEAFLKFSGWEYFEAIASESDWDHSVVAEWPSAYVKSGFRYSDRFLSAPVTILHAALNVHVSPSLSATRSSHRSAWFGWSWSDHPVGISEGKLVVSSYRSIRKFGFHRQRSDYYREVAEFAEGDLSWDMDGPVDTSIQEIRNAISGGDSGPVYLSDDVWL